MAYYIIGGILIFCQKLLRTGECYLINIFIYVSLVHANATVADCQRAGSLIDAYTHIHLPELAFEVAESRESLEFLSGIDGIAHQFAQKYLMVAVQELFDNGEYIFCSYPYFAMIFLS